MTMTKKASPSLVGDATAPWNGGKVYTRPGSGVASRSGGGSSSSVKGYCKLAGSGYGHKYSCAATYVDAFEGKNTTPFDHLPPGYLEIWS